MVESTKPKVKTPGADGEGLEYDSIEEMWNINLDKDLSEAVAAAFGDSFKPVGSK